LEKTPKFKVNASLAMTSQANHSTSVGLSSESVKLSDGTLRIAGERGLMSLGGTS
jgi:hypothetical protein